MNEPLGTLVKLNLQEAWETEAGHFTPWLAREENPALLGQTLEVELELVGQEQSVGPLRAAKHRPGFVGAARQSGLDPVVCPRPDAKGAAQ